MFVLAKSKRDLSAAVRIAHEHALQTTIIGFAANSLVSDAGVDGLVILNRADRIHFMPDYLVEADSGTNLATLARRAAKQGFGGLEFLIGIPGTVGAAVFGNTGTRQQWISEVVERVELLGENGKSRWIEARRLTFSYRASELQGGNDVVLSAVLRGHAREHAEIEARMQDYLGLRKNQPGGSSGGSVFKNPPGDFAGRLIEACGLKGEQKGGAEISPMHANFIVNKKEATASDIRYLIELARAKVKERFSILLEEEIKYLGKWS